MTVKIATVRQKQKLTQSVVVSQCAEPPQRKSLELLWSTSLEVVERSTFRVTFTAGVLCPEGGPPAGYVSNCMDNCCLLFHHNSLALKMSTLCHLGGFSAKISYQAALSVSSRLLYNSHLILETTSRCTKPLFDRGHLEFSAS